jgi:hypothetical protein
MMELSVADAIKPADARLWFAKSTHVSLRASLEKSVIIGSFAFADYTMDAGRMW